MLKAAQTRRSNLSCQVDADSGRNFGSATLLDVFGPSGVFMLILYRPLRWPVVPPFGVFSGTCGACSTTLNSANVELHQHVSPPVPRNRRIQKLNFTDHPEHLQPSSAAA